MTLSTMLAVVGGGRMGLPLAVAIAERGSKVVVCDLNRESVDLIAGGVAPFSEPGLDEPLASVVRAGTLTATTDTASAVSESRNVIVIVPAHLDPDQDIDYSILLSATADVGRGLRPRTLVSYETTVAVGGVRSVLVPELDRVSGLRAGTDYYVAFSPERVKANLVLSRLRETPKVVGGFDDESRQRAVAFYRDSLGAPIIDVGSLEAAELVKLAGMVYRDVNIALANELASYAEVVGVDFSVVREAANTDGEASLLYPGIGVGGHCTPVYPHFLISDARRRGVPQELPEMARRRNDLQPETVVRGLERRVGVLRDRRVHILGLAFRPDVKVAEFNTAEPLREALERRGAIVTLSDPLFDVRDLAGRGFQPATLGTDPIEIVILNTAHSAYLHPDFESWRTWGVELVLDGPRAWSPDAVEAAGLDYIGVGMGTATS